MVEKVKELDRNEVKTQEQANLKARQRVENKLNAMRELQGRANSGSEAEREEAQEEISGYALGVSKLIEVTIELSTGGDADGFKVYLDGEGEAVKGVFYWADWGQYAEYALTDEELSEVASFFYLEEYRELGKHDGDY